jgi:flagellar M-ring protein FliF
MADTELKLGGANTRQTMLVVGGALLAALFLFALWYLVIRTSYAPAFTELKSADASLIIEELKRQKIPYELTDNGTTVMVPEDQVDASRVNILGGDLPLKGTVGFELFNQSDMGLTEFAQKINYQRALQGELARTLMSLENIETARVHLSLPESGIFERDKRAAKASVTIAPKLGKTVDGSTVTGIQRLIASAVPDLDTTNVAVLDAQGQLLSQELLPAITGNAASLGSPVEQEYAARVRSAIAPLLSEPNVRVTVKIAEDLIKSAKSIDVPTAETDATQPATVDENLGRDFPIRISIILPDTPDAEMRGNLVPLLAESVGYDPGRGDSLMILTSPISLPPLATSSQRGEVIAKDQGDQTDHNTLFAGKWIWLFLALIFIPLLYFAMRKLTQQREMTLGQREAFSDRLRALVDEQGSRSRGTL